MKLDLILEDIKRNLDKLPAIDAKLKRLLDERARGVSNSREFSATLRALTAIKSLITTHLADLRAEYYLHYKELAMTVPLVSKKVKKKKRIEDVLEVKHLEVWVESRRVGMRVILRNRTEKEIKGEVELSASDTTAASKTKRFAILPYGTWEKGFAVSLPKADRYYYSYWIRVEGVEGAYHEEGWKEVA